MVEGAGGCGRIGIKDHTFGEKPLVEFSRRATATTLTEAAACSLW